MERPIGPIERTVRSRRPGEVFWSEAEGNS